MYIRRDTLLNISEKENLQLFISTSDMCFMVGMGGLVTKGGSQNCLGPQFLTSNSQLFVVFSFVVRVDIAGTLGHDWGLEAC